LNDSVNALESRDFMMRFQGAVVEKKLVPVKDNDPEPPSLAAVDGACDVARFPDAKRYPFA